ncbi:MAG TPA: DUF1295 domain-containing protein [Candidatus Binatia bacterium]|nr:DUF1295 domain-containing protein [Candidatus Binatia bacterium]
MTVPHVLALCALICAGAKTAAWLLQRRTGNAGIVDAAWAATLGTLALLIAEAGDAPRAVRLAIALMGGLWGLRLAAYLWRRNWGAPEDFRYAQLRARWGRQAQLKLFGFFQFQNVFTLLLAGSAFVPAAYRNDLPPPAAFAAAVALWLAAVLGEALADAQMAAFRRDRTQRGQVCRRGLWRWSRHPNYFFECVHWCAYVPLAWGAPHGAWSLLAPGVMAVLLTRISGMPLLETEMARRKAGYAEYIRTTSALVPWPPRA